MESQESSGYVMPAFDRVRENFLKRVEDDMKAKSSDYKSFHGNNPFIRSISNLGYSHTLVERMVKSCCRTSTIILDGNEKNLSFVLKLFQELVKVFATHIV